MPSVNPPRGAIGYERGAICDHAEPVFVLATARSYSTVSTAMLSCHPQIFGFPELQIFHAPTVAGLMAAPPSGANRLDSGFSRTYITEYERTGLYRALAEVHEKVQDQDAIARARLWLNSRADWPTELLMDYLLTLVSPRIGLEKSPRTISTQQSLHRCLTAYPRARFIHLVRHPVTTQRSMYRHWSRINPRVDNMTMRKRCADSWYMGNVRVIKALVPLPSSRWIRVKAEELLMKPDVMLPKALEWLGLDCSEDIIEEMKHPGRWPFAGRGDNGSLGGGDPRFLRSPELRPISAPSVFEFDRDWGVSSHQFQRMKLLAAYLGY
jgi:hypothetical protein